DGDGVISIAEFQAACGKGLVKYTMKSIAAASLREFCAAPPLPVSAYPCCRRLPTSIPLPAPKEGVAQPQHLVEDARVAVYVGPRRRRRRHHWRCHWRRGRRICGWYCGSVRSLAGDQARAMPKWAEAKTCAFPRVIGVFCDFQAI